jgi:hypothetical protein
MKALLAFLFAFCASWSFAQGGGPSPLQDDFLDGLVGRWTVTGTSHDLAMPQTVLVDWVLNHQFVRIDQKTTANRPGWSIPYEALLFIGYDPARKRYVLHVLNVMGAGGPPVAYGERQANEIKFEASTGELTVDMRLIWRPESGTWRCVWGSQPVGGPWQSVTDLALTREE